MIERSAGEWQTKCIEKRKKPTEADLKTICAHLGYANATDISYELLDPEQNIESIYQNPVKVITTKAFSKVKLNDNFILNAIRPSYETATHFSWNASDNANCNQLLINCGEDD